MRLKCEDGKTRKFKISGINEITGRYTPIFCMECGYDFGVHDTNIVKPDLKNHVCKQKDVGDWQETKETGYIDL